MSRDQHTNEQAPGTGSGGPESAQNPRVGTERRPGGPNGPQTDAQSLEASEATLKALKTREATIRDHTLALHQIGDQLATIESWFWTHLADVREAARQQIGGPLPDDVTVICVHPEGYEGECPCPPSCACCRVEAASPSVEQQRVQPSGPHTTTSTADRIRVLREIIGRIKGQTSGDSATEDAPAALVLAALEDLLDEQRTAAEGMTR